MDFKKLFPGQPIKQFPAGTQSHLVMAALRERAEVGPPPPNPHFGPKLPVHCLVYWSGAAALAPGNVVRLDYALMVPASEPSAPFREPLFYCSAFDGATTKGFAITLGPIAVGEIGPALIPEAWWARVYSNDAAQNFAALPSSGTVLQGSGTGLKILWREGTDGEQWAIVQLASESGRIVAGRVAAGGISAATGPAKANWGSGNVYLQDSTSGALDAATTAVDNDWIGSGASFVADAQVKVDKGYSPPRVLGGTCAAVSWS